MRGLVIGLGVLFSVSWTAGGEARTWYVHPGGGGDVTVIQAGIDSAGAGDTVLVAPGTYSGVRNVDLRMWGREMVVRSEAGPELTIIDCQGSQQIPHRGFNLSYGETPASVVEGFTIKGGYGPADFSFLRSIGGAISCLFSSPSIKDCVFEDNTADYGGGVFCHYAAPSFTGCAFRGNKAFWPGGGIYCCYSSPWLAECSFSENEAATSGGGVYCYDSDPTLVLSSFVRNECGMLGAGLACSRNSRPTITGCTFFENTASSAGGAISCNSQSAPLIERSILSFSLAGEAVYCGDQGSAPVLRCCDLFGNAGGDWVGYIADQGGIEGNFSEDPMFCASARLEIYLEHGSPCLSGYGCGRIGAYDMGCFSGSSRLPGTHGMPAQRGLLESAVPSTWGVVKALFETPER